MPRPGPRPYECIRRAWHSDSHQPLRGRLIQEIFRVVNELHSTSTRRKKEWQEKLPTVVFRAEEILYSKANSENEYLDVKTLRTRLDDAVNTMIRREDNDEGIGPYLQPCVEAALSLGCTPKKASRGHRQGSRLCSTGARRTNSTSLSPAAAIPTGTKFNSIPDLPYPSNGLVMQDTVSNTMYCETATSGFTRQTNGLNPIHSGSIAPMLTGNDFNLCYTSDGHTNSNANGGFPRGNEHPFIHPTFPSPCLPGYMRSSELGRLGSFPPVGSTTSYQLLPEASQEGRIAQSISISGTKTDTAFISSNLQWSYCSPLTANSIASSPTCLPQLFNPEAVTHTSSRVCADADAHMDAVRSRCKTLGSQIGFPVVMNFQLQNPRSASDEMQSSGTCTHGQEGTSTSLLRGLAPLVYEEPVCSSRRLSLKANPLIPAMVESKNAASSSEVHDLQLRLGPPGEVDKLTSVGHRLDDSVSAYSSTSSATCQRHNVSSWMKESLNAYEATPDVCFAARPGQENDVINRMRESSSSIPQVCFPAHCWDQNVECRKGAPNVDASTSMDHDMPESKRMRIQLHQTSSCEGMPQIDFSSKLFPWSRR